MPDSDKLRTTIVAVINQVRSHSGLDAIEPKDDDSLTGEIELDSLDLAQMVVAIEKELGVDPFRNGSATARTFGELVRVYEKATP